MYHKYEACQGGFPAAHRAPTTERTPSPSSILSVLFFCQEQESSCLFHSFFMRGQFTIPNHIRQIYFAIIAFGLCPLDSERKNYMGDWCFSLQP
jgi:hypothetical protein